MGTHDFRNFTVKVDEAQSMPEGSGELRKSQVRKQVAKKIKTYTRTITNISVEENLDLRP